MSDSKPPQTAPPYRLAIRTAGATAPVGLFILASSVVFTITGWLSLHNVLVGALIATLASVHVFRADTHEPSLLLAAVLALLGLWMIASPFVFGVSRELILGVNIATGLLVALLSVASIYGILSASRSQPKSDTGPGTGSGSESESSTTTET